MINNATQTIRRPAAYYRHLLPAEAAGAAALENSPTTAGTASKMLIAHYRLQTNYSNGIKDALLALPSSSSVNKSSLTAARELETACGSELESGDTR